jgi:hypothetical protein
VPIGRWSSHNERGMPKMRHRRKLVSDINIPEPDMEARVKDKPCRISRALSKDRGNGSTRVYIFFQSLYHVNPLTLQTQLPGTVILGVFDKKLFLQS